MVCSLHLKADSHYNTVIRTREPNVDRYVFWTFNHDSTFMNIRNNIFVVAGDIKVLWPYIKPTGHKRSMIGDQPHDHNLYFSIGDEDPIGIKPGKGDIIADPLFIDAKNENFRLSIKSPAINKGAKLYYSQDLDGYFVSRDGLTDIGAYEF